MSKKKLDSTNTRMKLDQVVRRRKLPILTLDSRWHILFPEQKKTSTIKKLEKQVNDLLKLQGKLIQDAKDLKQLKRNFMQEIVLNMKESTDLVESVRVKKLDSSQKYIMDINNKLAAMDDELERLPKKIRDTNEMLMIESVHYCYDELRENTGQITELNDWIQQVRETLKERIIIKKEMEEVNASIYSYMHDMLGPEVMEFFDSEQSDI